MGGKKGGGGSTPREALDTGRSKQLVKIVEVISEGEVEGFANGEKSIFFDNTPLRNADGSYNFSNTEWQARDGLQSQEMLSGFTTTEKEVSVSTEVKKAQPITRTITDGKVHRVRLTLGVSSLFQQNENGDTNGTQVDFKITVGNRVQTLSINGKYSSQYLRNVVIDRLPAVPFQIKVERVQADSTTQRLQNKTIWASYTEIIDNQFTYPNTALIGIKFDSEYFANIPTRTYDVLGIKVKVPSNYDPKTRKYNGLWDGSFKIAWTDNPAWILYDIVTSKRYGLGQRLGEFGADKWALYQVAQYCDQLVPDGFGNQEPRFTCNVWITEQRSAYDVINDICSIFRSMPVWNGTTLTVIQDRPADPVWTYTNANVIGGFSRQYSAMKARHNAVQVEYKDKANNYETTIEYVSDDDAIRRYGLNLRKVQAFGCTSRGQAYRTGKWILETERLETETITFNVGAEGLMHLPGDIIKVADSHYAGTEIGGRVLAVKGRTVTLDREIQINGNSYLSFINANAQHSNIKISAVKGNVVTLASNPTGLETLGVWSLTTEQITSRLYRALSIAENDDGSYTITALQHEPQKEAIVDNGASFEPRANTLHQVPKIEHLDVAVSAGNAGISWQTGSGSQIVSYDVKILKDGKLYALHKGLKTTELDLSDLPNGDYQIIIISRNASGQIIDEKSKTFTIDRPPAPQEVQVLGGLGDVMISWNQPDDFTETEIWASESNNLRTAKRVARVMANIYSHTIGARQTRYYWVRHARGQNLGAFFQEAGLRGETGEDIDAAMDELKEQLSTLDGSLVSASATLAQSNAELSRLGQSLLATNANVSAIRTNITTINANITATNSNVSKVVAQANAIKSDLTKEATLRQREITNVTANLTMLGNRLTGFEVTQTQQGNNLANVTKTVATLNNTSKQQAVDISGLSAKMSGAESNITKVNNALTTLNKTTAESLKQLNSNLSTNVTAITANVSALQRTVAENGRAFTATSEQLTARLDNLAVGGRNYANDGEFSLGQWHYSTGSAGDREYTIANGTVKITGNSSTWKQWQLHAQMGSQANNNKRSVSLAKLQSGEIYTLSFEARCISGSQHIWTRIRANTDSSRSDNPDVFRKDFVLNGEWQRYTYTAELPDVQGLDYWRLIFGYSQVGVVEYRKIKLEKGNIATDWTPAPEDSEQNLADISAELTAYKSAQANKENATATQISGLITRMGGAESKITNAEKAISTLNSSTAESVRQLNANLTTNISKINADITNVSKAVANETTARTQAINTLTANLNKANANITAVNTAIANETKSRAEALKTVTATLNNTTANVTAVSKAVTTLDGKVSAQYTIKAQALSEGRTAIAGIQLNAKDKESTVLVMADKFGVVASTNGAITPMFGVSGSGANAVATLNGDLIAKGSITASKIAVGGQNLILDPFFNDLAYWRENIATQGTVEDGVLKISLENVSASADGSYIRGLRSRNIAFVRGKRYRVSAKVKVTGDAASECRTTLYVSRYQNAENNTGWANVATIGDRYGNRDGWISGVVSTDNIPEDYGYFGIYFRIGVRANGGKITNAVVEISEITLLPMADGELIVDGAVTTKKIATGQVVTEHMMANSIDAKVLKAKTVTTDHLAADAVTANQINVTSLSAISTNIGTVTAGTIKGTTITGNTISGGTISGTTVSGSTISGGTVKGSVIEGGTIKGARIEGLTIEAQNIVGDVVKAYSAKYNGGVSETVSITIPASNKKRIAYIMPIMLSTWTYLGRSTSSTQFYENGEVSITVRLNNQNMITARATKNNSHYVCQGALNIPANVTAKIDFVVSKTRVPLEETNPNDGLPSTEFIVFCNNA
ncbi:Phage-related protein, tail component [Bibersteinia trehalosi USDA-ARS-USMARC-190]|uniref:Phage-related protein, tail component n=1 Tax=Bibersteinia trehalosi USDA-ARS-USMARC-190 TaxID=1263832 RepID=W0RD52_BIBTR|nr:phage tail protein [Bibersteinia trehalosi]AHG87313.1 Phage-related protein, tail component [Bibersteinia trehalosi USDA-ARS-USMARC-190]